MRSFDRSAVEKRKRLRTALAQSSEKRAGEGPRSWKYLDPSAMARLKGMEFVARHLVEGYFSGKHRSPEYGYSVEFADHREYTPGDEIRSIDWKVFGRTDKMYVKLYEEETNLLVYLLVDKSASMGYRGEGRISKLEYASYLAAALSFLMVRQGDRVGMGLFDESLKRYFRPGGNMPHLFSILRALEEIRPGKTTKVSEALHSMYPLINRRGLLVIVSDFLDKPKDLFDALNRYHHKGFETLLFQVLHPDELDLPERPNVRFVDMETSRAIVAEPRVVRKEYKAELQKFLDEIRNGCEARQIDYNLVSTATPYYVGLERYLVKRTRLLR